MVMVSLCVIVSLSFTMDIYRIMEGMKNGRMNERKKRKKGKKELFLVFSFAGQDWTCHA